MCLLYEGDALFRPTLIVACAEGYSNDHYFSRITVGLYSVRLIILVYRNAFIINKVIAPNSVLGCCYNSQLLHHSQHVHFNPMLGNFLFLYSQLIMTRDRYFLARSSNATKVSLVSAR